MNHNFKQNPTLLYLFQFPSRFSSYPILLLWSSLLLTVSVWWGLASWSSAWASFDLPASLRSFLQCPAAAGLAASQCLWQGKGGWRWIRGMTKICLGLTPFWFAGHCHTVRERVITVTFSHFKALRQVWFLKAVAHYWSRGPDFIQGFKNDEVCNIVIYCFIETEFHTFLLVSHKLIKYFKTASPLTIVYTVVGISM